MARLLDCSEMGDKNEPWQKRNLKTTRPSHEPILVRHGIRIALSLGNSTRFLVITYTDGRGTT